MRNTLALAVVALLAAPAAQAMTFSFDHATVIAQGPIVVGDGASLDRFLSAGHDNGQPLTTLILNSPGGLVREGIAMADAVHAYHVDTIVPDNAECASACFLPFAAGEHKTVGRDARVGIHSATSTGGRGDDDGQATMLMARYAAQLGVPSALVGRMVVTDSINMTWLSPDELRSMEVAVPVERPQKQATQVPNNRHAFYSWLYGGEPVSNTTTNPFSLASAPPRFPLIVTSPAK